VDPQLIESFGRGLLAVLAWPTFGYLLLGVAVGMSVGILPGIGGGVALAIMLSFTFSMQPMHALAFMLAMLVVCAEGGDITSILFGVPGESVSAALVMDGHAMAKRGEAGRALGAAMGSATVGNLVGVLAFVAAIPIVRPIVLACGAPEFFMLSLLGITFVAALSGNAVLNGLISGAMGLMLSTVGMDQHAGIERYTFGLTHLWDGVGLVPITIGLFAIPELMDLAMKGTSIAERRARSISGVLDGIKDTLRYPWLNVKCSLLGFFTGMMPGMGGAVGQWLAYAYAAKSSASRQEFGKGAIEGVMAPSAATNSKEGGNLLTAVTFGIPTSVSTAILLGGFLIQGIQPGQAMLTKHLDLTMAMAWVMFFSDLIVVAVILLFVRQLAMLTFVRASLMTPPIVLLLYLGTFAEKNDLADMMTMLVFGLLGVLMDGMNWARPPLILGLVLGPLVENNLFISIGRYDMDWITRPGVLGLLAVIVAVVCAPIGKAAMHRWRGRKTAAVENTTLSREVRILEIVVTGILLLTVVAAVWRAAYWDTRALLFPWAVGLPLAGMLAGRLGMSVAAVRQAPARSAAAGVGPRTALARVEARRALAMSGWLFAFLALIWLFGFLVGNSVASLLYLVGAGRERWRTAAMVTAGMALFLFVMEYYVHVPFPHGLLLVNPLR
jgi:TctA family transporter